MDKLIDMNVYPVSKNLKALLKDKTTKKNIIFATPAYSSEGNPIKETEQMTEKILKGFAQCEIQPRVLKNREQQQERTRAKAEVFTPSWICNKMNNQCDEEWFGRKNVFNIEQNQGWQINTEKVKFDTKDGWKKYVDSKRLEITCGEAPYIVSRYDAATGEIIEIKRRIGILDRKLRVVNENTDNETEWFKWVLRAYQSVYGYEFQGDNLLIARINLLITFALKKKLADYFDEKSVEDIFDYIPPQKTNQIFTPRTMVKKMVDMLEQENPGCFDMPDKTFIDLYMKSGLYITEIVKRLYQSDEMKKQFPDSKERLKHIFEKQVYGLAPTEIIYKIATSYILGFDEDTKDIKHNFRQLDALPYAKEGTLDEVLDKLYSKEE